MCNLHAPSSTLSKIGSDVVNVCLVPSLLEVSFTTYLQAGASSTLSTIDGVSELGGSSFWGIARPFSLLTANNDTDVNKKSENTLPDHDTNHITLVLRMKWIVIDKDYIIMPQLQQSLKKLFLE